MMYIFVILLLNFALMHNSFGTFGFQDVHTQCW